MPKHYVEFAFKGKKVVEIDASTEEEALKIAQATMDSSHGPASGLKTESSWWNYDAPRLVDDFATRVRKQSEKFRSICDELGKGLAQKHQRESISPTPERPSAENGHTYYFSVPFSGQAVVEIKADDEKQALIAAQSAATGIRMKAIEPPFVSYTIRKEEPVMVRSDLT